MFKSRVEDDLSLNLDGGAGGSVLQSLKLVSMGYNRRAYSLFEYFSPIVQPSCLEEYHSEVHVRKWNVPGLGSQVVLMNV